MTGPYLAGSAPLCSKALRDRHLRLWHGTTALAAKRCVGGSVGLGALASAPLSANGINAKVESQGTGSTATPPWPATLAPGAEPGNGSMFSTITGVITGLGIAVLLQQGWIRSPELWPTALKGAIIGGGQ